MAITFGPPAGPHLTQFSWGNTFIRRTLQEGDIVNLLVESSMAGGYWYDLRRFLSIGPVPAAYREAWEIAKEARADHGGELQARPAAGGRRGGLRQIPHEQGMPGGKSGVGTRTGAGSRGEARFPEGRGLQARGRG